MNRIILTLAEVIEQIKRINEDNYVETRLLIVNPVSLISFPKNMKTFSLNTYALNDVDIEYFYNVLGNGLYEKIISHFKNDEFDSIELEDEFKKQAFAMGLTSKLEASPYFHYGIAIGLGSELKFKNLGADPYGVYNQEIERLSNKILHLGSDPSRIEYLNFSGITKTKWIDSKKRLWGRIYQLKNGVIVNNVMLFQDSAEENLFYFGTIDPENEELDPEIIRTSVDYLLEIIPIIINQETCIISYNKRINTSLDQDKRFVKLSEVGKYKLVYD